VLVFVQHLEEELKKKNRLFGIAAKGWIDTTSYIKPMCLHGTLHV